jgi:hypothetical protein
MPLTYAYYYMQICHLLHEILCFLGATLFCQTAGTNLSLTVRIEGTAKLGYNKIMNQNSLASIQHQSILHIFFFCFVCIFLYRKV